MRILDLIFEFMGHIILILEFPEGVDTEITYMVIAIFIKVGF